LSLKFSAEKWSAYGLRPRQRREGWFRLASLLRAAILDIIE
jgi:hypothetical protein